VISIANNGLELREKCGQAKQRRQAMKIGMVISGGDVSGINNFIFQIARLASADITFLMAEYPDCWIKIITKSPGAIWLISPLPLFRSLPPGEPAVDCCAVNMKQ
jgi:hypothetical protein